jgi:hypothetical protein
MGFCSWAAASQDKSLLLALPQSFAKSAVAAVAQGHTAVDTAEGRDPVAAQGHSRRPSLQPPHKDAAAASAQGR